jgi:hypothetical protein
MNHELNIRVVDNILRGAHAGWNNWVHDELSARKLWHWVLPDGQSGNIPLVEQVIAFDLNMTPEAQPDDYFNHLLPGLEAA